MISFQEAIQKNIEEVEERLYHDEMNLRFWVEMFRPDIDAVFVTFLANCIYHHELLEALKGIERLEKAKKHGYLYLQLDNEKQCR